MSAPCVSPGCDNNSICVVRAKQLLSLGRLPEAPQWDNMCYKCLRPPLLKENHKNIELSVSSVKLLSLENVAANGVGT